MFVGVGTWQFDNPPAGAPTLSLPTGYEWFNHQIYYDFVLEQWLPNYDFEAAKPTGGTSYYVFRAGSDSNNGLTSGTAFKTMAKLLSMSGGSAAGEGIIESGEWELDDWQVLLTNLNRNLALRSHDGNDVEFLAYYKAVTWTPSGTVANAYEADLPSTIDVWDKTNPDENGKSSPLSLAANAAAVGTTLDRYFPDVTASFTGVINASGVLTASSVTGTIGNGPIGGQSVPRGTVISSQLTGTAGGAGTYQTNISRAVVSTTMKQGKLFVRTFDDRAPDDDILAIQPSSFQIRNNNLASSTIWMDGIKFRGNQRMVLRIISSTNYLTVHARGLENDFSLATDNSAVRFLGCDYYLTDCHFYQSFRDGISSDYSGRKSRGMDLNCSARKSGARDPVNTNNNAFTGHSGGTFISFNPIGLKSRGPNFAYVHGLTKAIIFNPTGADSVRPTFGNNFTSGSGQGVNPAEPGSDGGTKLCIIGGTSSGSVDDLICDQTAHIYLHNFTPANPSISGQPANVHTFATAQEALDAMN